jgi:protocatechuate 3,4-dioxygenase beta subunit
MTIDRRTVLRQMGLGLAALPLACSDPAASPDAMIPDANVPDAIDPEGWASGGTVAMTDKGSYPDPFTGTPTSCVIVASTTAGPCTTPAPLDREDISEGWAGLPVRLGLKILDIGCAPIAGATVSIWHTNLEGVYSGDTPNPTMCSGDDPLAIAADYMRGVQTTAADGTVYFDTCFPGWYPGRAIHIHFQVSSGATTYRISQLFFPEDVTEGIFATHVDYAGFGQPDTSLANDGVLDTVASTERPRLFLEVARMTDGAMLASKVVTVTS